MLWLLEFLNEGNILDALVIGIVKCRCSLNVLVTDIFKIGPVYMFYIGIDIR